MRLESGAAVGEETSRRSAQVLYMHRPCLFDSFFSRGGASVGSRSVIMTVDVDRDQLNVKSSISEWSERRRQADG
jgi:hypothetical protein